MNQEFCFLYRYRYLNADSKGVIISGYLSDMKVPLRSVPIPCIHKKRRFKQFRHCRTTNEIRQNEGAVADGLGQHVRGSRRRYSLPTYFDDTQRGDFRVKCWKNASKRKQQYKDKQKSNG